MKKKPSKAAPPPTEEEEEEVTEISSSASPDEDDPMQALEQDRDEFKDKYLRTYADYENYRKRVAREKEDLLKFGNEKLLKEILFIKDNLDLALSHKDTADTNTLKEGLELISREFDKLMQQMNVEVLSVVGESFDPELHEAIAEEESDAVPGTILKEYQSGYIFHGRLLRPARVVVAKKKAESS